MTTDAAETAVYLHPNLYLHLHIDLATFCCSVAAIDVVNQSRFK